MALVTISNVSNQTVPIICDTIAEGANGNSFDASVAGLLNILPSKRVELDTERVSLGQLAKLANLGLIQYAIR